MMFARTFPMTHPRKGEPTYFVEKIWKSLYVNGVCPDDLDKFIQHYEEQVRGEYAKYNDIHLKGHTVRAGNRWKVGDYFKPLVWSGRPYNSKTIQFAPPIRVEKLWRFSVINHWMCVDGVSANSYSLENIARNDGLSFQDFLNWFMPLSKKPEPDFEGQIISWSKNIDY